MRGVPVNRVAKRAGICTSTLQAIVTKGVTPRADTLSILIDYLGLDANWVLFGYGEQRPGEPVLSPMIHIPLLRTDMVSAGIPEKLMLSTVVSIAMPRSVIPDAEGLAAFEVTGCSMEPMIPHGHYVVCDTRENDPKKADGDVMVVNLPNLGPVVKHVHVDGEWYIFGSANPQMGDLVLQRKLIHSNAFIGRVIYEVAPNSTFHRIG